MKKLILIVSIFILSFLLSGCTKTIQGLTDDTQGHIDSILEITPPIHTEKHTPIQTYKVPKLKYCTKSMSLKQCFIMQNKSANKLRYTLIKQRNVVLEHNRRYR